MLTLHSSKDEVKDTRFPLPHEVLEETNHTQILNCVGVHNPNPLVVQESTISKTKRKTEVKSEAWKI